MTSRSTLKIIHKDSKARCGCGQTVLWKYIALSGYIRTNEAGTEAHYCHRKTNPDQVQDSSMMIDCTRSGVRITALTNHTPRT